MTHLKKVNLNRQDAKDPKILGIGFEVSLVFSRTILDYFALLAPSRQDFCVFSGVINVHE